MSARASSGASPHVIWGAIRGLAELATGSFPVYASARDPPRPLQNGPGEINVPITVGGMPVNPGDIIVGDADGLVAFRRAGGKRSSPREVHPHQRRGLDEADRAARGPQLGG